MSFHAGQGREGTNVGGVACYWLLTICREVEGDRWLVALD